MDLTFLLLLAGLLGWLTLAYHRRARAAAARPFRWRGSPGKGTAKVWGDTECLLARPGIEIHRINGKQGGFCSKHRHAGKQNWFYVIGGCLIIHEWPESGPVVTVLRAGKGHRVSPGVLHQFRAQEDTQALEVYWSELDPADIQRESEGGTA